MNGLDAATNFTCFQGAVAVEQRGRGSQHYQTKKRNLHKTFIKP